MKAQPSWQRARPPPAPVLPGWTKATTYRWERGDYRIIEVIVGKRARYCAQHNPERKYCGRAEAWHDTPAQAVAWCDAHQADGAVNGGT